jgi:hypothetical protein
MFQMLLPLASKMLTSKVMMSAGAKMMLNVGASALGTHLDNQQIKKQNARAAAAARARQGNFYVNLRNAAQRAGFNPLTVLRSGTAGAYQAEGNSYDTMPLLTSNSFANMMMDAEESQVRMDNMRAQERNMQQQQNIDKLNYELRKAELEVGQRLATQELINKVPSGITVMDSNNAANVTTDEGVDLPNDPAIPAGYTVPKEVMEQFPIHLGAISLSGSPMSPAAVVEEQYGDFVSWIYGPAKAVGDLYYTGFKYAVDNGAQGYNHPKRGEMLKQRLQRKVTSTPWLSEKPSYGEQWSMYAP